MACHVTIPNPNPNCLLAMAEVVKHISVGQWAFVQKYRPYCLFAGYGRGSIYQRDNGHLFKSIDFIVCMLATGPQYPHILAF